MAVLFGSHRLIFIVFGNASQWWKRAQTCLKAVSIRPDAWRASAFVMAGLRGSAYTTCFLLGARGCVCVCVCVCVSSWSLKLNPFTATGRIYMSQKRPSRWPRPYILYVLPQFRFYAFVKARPLTWLLTLLHASKVFSSSVVDRFLLCWVLSIEKTVHLCFPQFCPNGGKQRCGCFQM